jgi:hypothetical protein
MGTPTYTPPLPSGWVTTTTGGQVKLTYVAALPVKLVSFLCTKEAKVNFINLF